MDITIEQLMAQGLTEEEAKAYLEAVNKGKRAAQLPFDVAKVSYIADIPETIGQLIGGVVKDEEGNITDIKYIFGKKPMIRILAVYGQFSKYNPNTGKVEVSSTIHPLYEIKKAVDIKSGKPIYQLKEKDNDIKLQLLVLMEAKDIKTNEWVPVVMFMKGAFMYNFNQNVKPTDYIKKIITFELVKKRKGMITYFVPDNFEFQQLSDEEVLKNVKKDAENIKKLKDWIFEVNSMAENAKEIEETADIDESIFE